MHAPAQAIHSPNGTIASCIIQVGVLPANQSSYQSTEPTPPAPLPNPPQAVTPAGSASAAALLKQLSSKHAPSAECRICLSAGSAELELIQPCACAGTMGYMHAACLAAWVQENGSLTCELCKQRYQEPYVQELGLAAAVDKTGQKEGAGPAAAAALGNSCRSWSGMRLWML
jgi:hypothetical protein